MCNVSSTLDAALQTVHGDSAHVLVAVSVATTNAGTPEPQPRAWRMKFTVERLDSVVKIADVEFVA